MDSPFGSTLRQVSSSLFRPHLGGRDNGLTPKQRAWVIVCISAFVCVMGFVLLLKSGTEESQKTGGVLLGLVVGYWLR
jgi:hypothetical protein